MNEKKKIIIILTLFIIVLSTIIYWKKNGKCEGCGGCDYEKFTDKIKVKKIIWQNDSIYEIHFKSNIDSNWVYRLYLDELKEQLKKDFNKKTITDTLKTYTISGERITRGACTPYVILKMNLNKK